MHASSVICCLNLLIFGYIMSPPGQCKIMIAETECTLYDNWIEISRKSVYFGRWLRTIKDWYGSRWVLLVNGRLEMSNSGESPNRLFGNSAGLLLKLQITRSRSVLQVRSYAKICGWFSRRRWNFPSVKISYCLRSLISFW